MDITARIGERADKCFSVQTYGMMSVGAVRMEEVKVDYRLLQRDLIAE
jgi:hypothetical protein